MTKFRISAEGKFVAGNCVEIQLLDEIVHVRYLNSAEITAEIKHEMHLIFLEITKGKKHPFLYESEGSLWFTKEARDYAYGIEKNQPFLAVAIFAPTLGYRLIAEYYNLFNKPYIPYKIFEEKEKAVEWLKNFQGN